MRPRSVLADATPTHLSSLEDLNFQAGNADEDVDEGSLLQRTQEGEEERAAVEAAEPDELADLTGKVHIQ